MKILFVTIPEKGHINPYIGIAQQLVARDVEISFFAQSDFSEQLKRAGLTCKFLTPDSNGFKFPSDHATRGKEFAERIKDIDWLRRWIKRLLLEVVPGQIESFRRQVKEFRPDVIVSDPMVYSAVIVAETEGIPWAGISSSLNPVTPDEWRCELVDTVKGLSIERNELFSKYGIKGKFKICDAISPWLNIVFTTEEYAPRRLSNNDFSYYVGPGIPSGKRGDETDFPFDRLNRKAKKVYMSLGSQLYYHPELFDTVCRALSRADIQLIFSLSDLYFEPFARTLPENVIVTNYAPQLELFKCVDLMISHGGANSVMECLFNSCPIALLPLCNDQFLQAEFIKLNRVGVILDSARPSVNKYQTELLRLLEEDSPERKNAEFIGRSYAKYNGASLSADLVLELAYRKRPMKP